MSLTDAYNSVKRALFAAPPNDAYLRWDAPGVETPEADEDAKAKQIGETMNKMQQHNLDQHRHAFRATHVKTQGIVKGKLTVLRDLPDHLQQGLFKTPGKSYDIAARYANSPGADMDTNTQDFFFNNAPMIELTDIGTCLEIMQIREKYFDSPTKLAAATKLRTDAIKQSTPGMLPNTHMTHMISHSFYSPSAFRFGDSYGHMALFPSLEDMTSQTQKVKNSDFREVLRDWLVEYSAEHGARYEFKIQLGTSPEHHPTEDASIIWDEATAPYQTIAIIDFPPQDALTAERRIFWEDRMRFNPWDALVAHRPLGSINRRRKIVYDMSRRKRESEHATLTKTVRDVADIP